MTWEFDGQIKRLEGKIQWRVVYFPESALDCFGTKGSVPVKITVDGQAFEHTLLGSRNGHYFVYNEFIHRAVGKEIGDIVRVTLTKDDAPRIFTTPPVLEKILKEHGVLDAFLKQPDYLKREQVNKIELAKKEETKRNRIQKLVELFGGSFLAEQCD
ncbi:MAG: YdeI/OmpD-associated family protein [Oscillospiraceae bacterium]|nr:YdeI/OmpD-associated family protein [Oscillospiraceae bacterium]